MQILINASKTSLEAFKRATGVEFGPLELTSDKDAVAVVVPGSSLLSFLPFILIGVSRIVSPEYTAPLFTTTSGIIVLIFCVLAVVLANKIVNKMVEGLYM